MTDDHEVRAFAELPTLGPSDVQGMRTLRRARASSLRFRLDIVSFEH